MSEYNSAYTGAQIDEAVRKSLADVENPVASFNGRTGAVMPQTGDYTAAMVGAISQDDLQSATDAALEQAKNSGEFDGADGQDGSDGVSCTHSWNGTTLTVTSASGTSSADLKGDKGDTGGTGATGVGIASVQQTTTSTADDGNNIITVTLTDGTTHTFTVQNGSKGSTGATGADGAAGSDGKNAYESAQDGGYTGTEAEFNAALSEVNSASKSATITIPVGRMRGDVDGDGKFTQADYDLIFNHNAETALITDATQLLAADVNNDGKINAKDYNIYLKGLINGTALIGQYGEVTGNWTINPNYETEVAQFYADIAIDGMTAISSAVVTIQGYCEHDAFRAECIDGAIRIYAKLCPISEVKAVVQFGAGDGSTVLLCEGADLSDVTKTATIAIPAGRMKGDLDGDGLITTNDVAVLVAGSLDETQTLAADINGDGIINVADRGLVNAMAAGTQPVGMGGDITGNWTVNPNYATETAQFYTDIPIAGMTATNSATVSVKGNSGKVIFYAECLDGAIRVYATLCPIGELKAVVQYGAGDGSAVVVCESVALTFDETPTEGSTNPVTSGGIKSYVDEIVGDIESALAAI